MIKQIQEYNDPDDALMLPMVYNKIKSYIRAYMDKEAIELFRLAIDGLIENSLDDKLIATWPSINLGMLYSATGQAEEGNEIVSPILAA